MISFRCAVLFLSTLSFLLFISIYHIVHLRGDAKVGKDGEGVPVQSSAGEEALRLDQLGLITDH